MLKMNLIIESKGYIQLYLHVGLSILCLVFHCPTLLCLIFHYVFFSYRNLYVLNIFHNTLSKNNSFKLIKNLIKLAENINFNTFILSSHLKIL